MIDFILEWFSTFGRWLHVMAGIAWIGTSFYFNWFDSLVRPAQNSTLRPNHRGTLEEIHGGSFYYHEQYWPRDYPHHLMRHSWPAKTTFLSGIFLLATIYWVGASSYLVDKNVLDVSTGLAIAISFGSIAFCWMIYRSMCMLTDSNRVVLLLMGVIILFASWGYYQVFGARAAYLHVGALMGSMMGLNVWFVIIPNHIAMTQQLQTRQMLDTHCGYLAKRASQHNNYYSIPVLFSMVSNHFAFVYNHQYAWLILWLLLCAGWGIRYAFNVYYVKNHQPFWLYVFIVIMFLLAMGLSAIPRPVIALTSPIGEQQAINIVQKHCVSCHSSKPTHTGFLAPPQGLILDNRDHILAAKDRIYQRILVTRDMPLANVTQMTDKERAQLAHWITEQP